MRKTTWNSLKFKPIHCETLNECTVLNTAHRRCRLFNNYSIVICSIIWFVILKLFFFAVEPLAHRIWSALNIIATSNTWLYNNTLLMDRFVFNNIHYALKSNLMYYIKTRFLLMKLQTSKVSDVCVYISFSQTYWLLSRYYIL